MGEGVFYFFKTNFSFSLLFGLSLSILYILALDFLYSNYDFVWIVALILKNILIGNNFNHTESI